MDWIQYISIFKYLSVYIDEKRTHYHFKKRKDMKEAMKWNLNTWDTFYYDSKNWEEIITTKEMLQDK